MSKNVSNLPPVNALIDLDLVEAWPEEIGTFLSENLDLFHDWSVGPKTYSAHQYDQAIYQLVRMLRPYTLKAWHCTRLTEGEIYEIVHFGMKLPNPSMLVERIDALVSQGVLAKDDSDSLKAKNQAHEPNRRDRVWFCFYPPIRSGEGGIRALLSTWGGEALYNSHDRDADMGPKLRAIGVPCLVEALIPIAMLGDGVRAAFTFVARYLAHRGLPSRDHLDFEDRVTEPLPANRISRVIRFPSEDFLNLTGVDRWASSFP